MHYLQLSIECVIDIGEVLISALKLPKPEDVRGVIEILGKNGIIPDEFARSFATVASFRNIIVHEYRKVDLDKVHEHLQSDLDDFDFYAKKIAQFLQKTRREK